ncbi:MAG TPA: nuclear transport factor 2 family protein [Bacteroidota bacterium]|nr:nuclear transport factor 2 family protein [Bacteroidota bacterium]
MLTPTEIALAFIQAINRHEIGAITSLMTPDHVFVDSLGVTMSGREKMREAWIAYLYMIPDYTLAVADVFSAGDRVVLTGKASGTVAVKRELPPENHWEIPVAVQAQVREGLIARWQVFADNEPVRQILKPR